jgi:hypothetical protein
VFNQLINELTSVISSDMISPIDNPENHRLPMKVIIKAVEFFIIVRPLGISNPWPNGFFGHAFDGEEIKDPGERTKRQLDFFTDQVLVLFDRLVVAVSKLKPITVTANANYQNWSKLVRSIHSLF